MLHLRRVSATGILFPLPGSPAGKTWWFQPWRRCLRHWMCMGKFTWKTEAGSARLSSMTSRKEQSCCISQGPGNLSNMQCGLEAAIWQHSNALGLAAQRSLREYPCMAGSRHHNAWRFGFHAECRMCGNVGALGRFATPCRPVARVNVRIYSR